MAYAISIRRQWAHQLLEQAGQLLFFRGGEDPKILIDRRATCDESGQYGFAAGRSDMEMRNPLVLTFASFDETLGLELVDQTHRCGVRQV